MRTGELLLEAYGRLPGIIERAVAGLAPEQLVWAPAGGANTIGWLVWHLTRIQDHHMAQVREDDQVWDATWAARFGIGADAEETGYAHTPEQVAAVRPESAQALLDYYGAVAARTNEFLETVTDDGLDRVVDWGWDPPVTLGVRLVSVLGDDLQHAGQASYLRGLLPE